MCLSVCEWGSVFTAEVLAPPVLHGAPLLLAVVHVVADDVAGGVGLPVGQRHVEHTVPVVLLRVQEPRTVPQGPVPLPDHLTGRLVGRGHTARAQLWCTVLT